MKIVFAGMVRRAGMRATLRAGATCWLVSYFELGASLKFASALRGTAKVKK